MEVISSWLIRSANFFDLGEAFECKQRMKISSQRWSVSESAAVL